MTRKIKHYYVAGMNLTAKSRQYAVFEITNPREVVFLCNVKVKVAEQLCRALDVSLRTWQCGLVRYVVFPTTSV